MTNTQLLRTIKSFVLRQGRITDSQEKAFNALFPHYGIDVKTAFFSTYFDPDQTPLNLEIGFGMGDALCEMALATPDQEWLGIEVHRPGVGRALNLIHTKNLKNVHVIQDDAVEVLKYFIPDHSLSKVCLFFADPWPKQKHHKRRIVQPDFVELIARKLKPAGIFHLATDWENYAEHMMEILTASPSFKNRTTSTDWSDRGDRPFTKFETRGLKLGHQIFDLFFISLQEA